MKKIIYLIAVIGVFFTACKPMEDVYADIDAQENVIVGEKNFTLDSDDYKAITEITGDDDYENYENFSTVDDAKTQIALLLADKYPVWGKGSLAEVTFNLYKSNSIQNEGDYEVTPQDYTDLGFNFGNFGNSNDLITFLTWKYSSATRGDLVELEYRYYVGGGVTEDRINNFLFLDEWSKLNEFSNADYTAMGQNYPNFSDHDVAKYRIGIFLGINYPYAVAGDQMLTLYKKYEGGGVTSKNVAPYTFDGTNWNYIGNVIEESIKFGHNGSVWEPDNTINYTLTNADYALVGNGNYNNFDVRAGKDEEMESVRLDKINTILLNNFPSNAEGQKYSVSYAVWNNANEVWNLKVILASGVYIKND